MDGNEWPSDQGAPRSASNNLRLRGLLGSSLTLGAVVASQLLFRDKRRALHLYDIASQTRSTLLSFSSYVQWVPNSDVVVAQNRGNLCVWYHIEAPEKVTVVPIKGDVEDIERAPGRTEVIVDEGMNTVSYQLNEALIAFGTAVDEGDLNGACSMLERLEHT